MTGRRTRGEAARGGGGRLRGRLPSIRPWMVLTAVVIVASVVAVAVEGSREAARERSAALIPRHSIAEAEQLIGRRVVVSGDIGIELPRAFVIREREAPDELLVLLPEDVDVPVDEGEPVLVDGVVERFVPGLFEAYGPFNQPDFTRFTGEPAIVARAVETSGP